MSASKKTKSSDVATAESGAAVAQVQRKIFSRYADISWTLLRPGVQYSQVLAPPGHLASFVRLEAGATKGLCNTAANVLVLVVMEGKVTLVTDFLHVEVSCGDSFFMPQNSKYDLHNKGDNVAEIFMIQYKENREKNVDNNSNLDDNANSEKSPIDPAPAAVPWIDVTQVARHPDAWTNAGREEEGVAWNSVQHSQVLRPHAKLASFVRMEGESCQGMTNTGAMTLVFVVMSGKVNVVINSFVSVAGRGDTFYVPCNTVYNFVNTESGAVELFKLHYRTQRDMETTKAFYAFVLDHDPHNALYGAAAAAARKLEVEDSSHGNENCQATECREPIGEVNCCILCYVYLRISDYCLVQQVYWVQCDECDRWYHFFCIGLEPSDIKEDEDFNCDMCLNN